MKQSLARTAGVLALAALAAGALPADPPCIEDGETGAIEFDRPPLGVAGDPIGAKWQGGDGAPTAADEDVVYDDPMGDAEPSEDGSTATVDVENKGGNLSGPNGEVVNGGADGACAEVYVTWTFLYPADVKVCLSGEIGWIGEGGGAGAVGFERCATVRLWMRGQKIDGPKEVCPC